MAVPGKGNRWMAIPFILIIGLILWIGVLSDSSGHLTMPGAGSIIYVAAVVAVAAVLGYTDWKRNNPKRNRKGGSGGQGI
jgi:hypothetical protein